MSKSQKKIIPLGETTRTAVITQVAKNFRQASESIRRKDYEEAIKAQNRIHDGIFLLVITDPTVTEAEKEEWNQALQFIDRNVEAMRFLSSAQEEAAPPTKTTAKAKTKKQAAAAGGADDEKDQCPTEFQPVDVSQALNFDQIIGLENVKERVEANVVTPLLYANMARALKLEAPNVLLYGPGGTGKTTIVEAIAKQLANSDKNIPLYNATAGDIKGKFVGQSEKCFQKLFELGQDTNGIIFIDEVDSLLAGQGDIEKSFQASFKQVVQPGKSMPPPVLMSATNVPWDITDDAIQRRYGIKLYVSLPTRPQRRQYLQMLSQQLRDCRGDKSLLPFSDDQWEQILDKTKGFSPDDLRNLFNEARRKNHLSLSNYKNLVFCPDAEGMYEVLSAAEAAAAAGSTANCVNLEDISEYEHSRICWPQATYEGFMEVLNNNEVRASNTVQTLERFKWYAEKVQDFKSIPEIQRSIDELQEE